MNLKVTAITLASLIATQAIAGAHYATTHNSFGSIERIDGITSIEGDMLLCNNTGFTTRVVTDTTGITAGQYRLQARMANEHNSPRHSYRVTDSNGNKHNVHSPQWGIAFDIGDNIRDYWAVTMQCIDTDINNDITNHRYAHFTLLHYSNGKAQIIATQDIDRGINLSNGFNSIEVQVKPDVVKVLAGENQLQTVMQINRPYTDTQSCRAGCYIGAGAKVKIERVVIDFKHETTIYRETGWTIETLKEHFQQSADPVEGFWQYIDRDMEERWLRLGGRYTLAIVASDSGYDLIYISGATTRSDLWHTGMLKATLTKTIFNNHYDLKWIDATHNPITQDAYGSIENGVLLTLKFPIYKSQFRLSKILDP